MHRHLSDALSLGLMHKTQTYGYVSSIGILYFCALLIVSVYLESLSFVYTICVCVCVCVCVNEHISIVYTCVCMSELCLKSPLHYSWQWL